MAISAGDVVLTFSGDSTELNKTFDEVNRAAKAAIQPATSDMAAMQARMAQVETHSTALTEKLGRQASAHRQVSKDVTESRGTLSLLGEQIGVVIPRHLQTFIAQLPGVGAALSNAFVPVAVFALIEVLSEAGKAIEELIEKQDRIAAAWVKYDETVFATSQHVNAQIDSQGQKIVTLTAGPVAGLDFALKHLETTAFQTFASISSGIDAATKAMKEESSSLLGINFNVFADSAKDLEKFKDQLSEVQRVAKLSAPDDQFAAYNAGIALAATKEQELTALIKKRTAASGQDASAAVDGLKAELKAVEDLKGGLKAGTKLDVFNDITLELEKQQAVAAQNAEQAKRSLDLQIAKIEDWKTQVHIAYAAGNADASTWAAAQVTASDLADAAHEKYQQRLVGIYAQSSSLARQQIDAAEATGKITAANAEYLRTLVASSDALKVQAAAQELVVLKEADATKQTEALAAAIQKHNEMSAKMMAEWVALTNVAVGKAFDEAAKSAQRLTETELRLGEAQKNLSLAQFAAEFSKRADAIQALADLGVTSEEQKIQQLGHLYEVEKNQALSALEDQLQFEKAAIDAANQNLVQGRQNPFLTDGQILDLQRNLDLAETAYARTFTQIITTQSQFEAKYAQNEDQLLRKATQSWKGFFQVILQGSLSSSHAMQAGFDLMTRALGDSVEAAVSGSQGFGHAMEQMAKTTLASLASEAVVLALKSLGWAFYYLGVGDYVGATDMFTSAAEFGAVAAVAGLAGAAIPSGNSSGGGASGSTGGATSPPTTAETPQQQPVSTINVQKLASGGVATKPTLAVVGDAPGGELVLPLKDNRAQEFFTAALEAAIPRIQPRTLAPEVPALSAVGTGQQQPQQQAQTTEGSTNRLAGSAAEPVNQSTIITNTILAMKDNRAQEFFATAIEAAVPRIQAQPTNPFTEVISPRVLAPVIPINERRASGRASGADQPASETHNHYETHNWEIQVMSQEAVHKLVKDVNKGVAKGTLRIKSNSSYRVTKRG